MITYVSTIKTGRKQIATAIVTYPEGSLTCVAAAEAFLSEQSGIPRHKLNVSYLDSISKQKNYVQPAGIPTYAAP